MQPIMKPFIILILLVLLSACQSTQITPANIATMQVQTTTPIIFNITGKIGITTTTADGRTGGSAFYAWGQDQERFAIDLTGVLGLGRTQIRYDGQNATLINDQGVLTATNPNDLLLKATGWHAPIDKLPSWVMGRTADGDTDSLFNDQRLIQSKNSNWTATFDYSNQDVRPSRIVMTHADGHRVVMTITHRPS